MKRILFLTGREVQYGRNQVLLDALKKLGEVIVIDLNSTSIFKRSILISIKALPRVLFSKFDLIFIGFYGNLLLLPIRLFSKTPILFDAFISTYDTLCFDRKVISPNSVPGRLAFWLDQYACQSAAAVLVDTDLHREYFSHTFHLNPETIYPIPVGCDETTFFPRPDNPVKQNRKFRILFYCTYLPIHGVETVIRTAALLKNEPVEFELIGNGPEYHRIVDLARRENLVNVSFEPPVPPSVLAQRIAQADICLAGPFGISDKANRIIPGKLYQILAMQKLAIVTDTPANRDFLVHGESAWFCQPADPVGLKNSIQFLMENLDLTQQIAERGRKVFESKSTEVLISQKIKEIAAQLLRDPSIKVSV